MGDSSGKIIHLFDFYLILIFIEVDILGGQSGQIHDALTVEL